MKVLILVFDYFFPYDVYSCTKSWANSISHFQAVQNELLASYAATKVTTLLLVHEAQETSTGLNTNIEKLRAKLHVLRPQRKITEQEEQ